MNETQPWRADNGVANQLELLDAQRNLLNAQLSWASAWQSQQGATLAMVRALGGGFNAEQVALKE
jgi:multidrug efflux system outer membrane protein